MTKFRRDLLLRVAAALLLGGAALTLFLLDRGPSSPSPGGTIGETSRIVVRLDEGIDSVLTTFQIDTARVRKRNIALSPGGVTRTERRITIGPSITPVVVNAALNDMARGLDARAVATENPRYNIVTIHVSFGGVVYHTIIMKTDTLKNYPSGPPASRSI